MPTKTKVAFYFQIIRTLLSNFMFLSASFLYLLNRYVIKCFSDYTFFQNYLNDFLFFPCAAPLLIALLHALGFRKKQNALSMRELALLFLWWSLLFEFIGPTYLNQGVADGWDVLSYMGGAVFYAIREVKVSRFPFVLSRPV
jgi:hypothetical protein